MDKLTILLADYLPLANKGEEAILRGIQDMFGGPEAVETCIFTHTEHAGRVDDINVFPVEWGFRIAGRLLTWRQRTWRRVLSCLGQRLGFYGRAWRMARSRHPRFEPLRSYFDRCHLVLVGHDAMFSPETCAMIHVAHAAGKPVGILGAGFELNRRMRPFAVPVYRKAVEESRFVVLRERRTLRLLREISGSEKLRLAPDPAFAMAPAPADETSAYLNRVGFLQTARERGRPVVLVTVCEKSVAFRASFRRCTGLDAKRDAHVRFVARLLDGLIRERGASVMFLPHAIEPGIGNDVEVARRIRAQMASPQHHHWILEDDVSPRLLKGIIATADFLVGERTHSLIGAVDVGTPFVALTNTTDGRTHDIIGDMSESANEIIDMDAPDVLRASRTVLSAFERREDLRKKLRDVAKRHRAELAGVAESIRAQVPNG